ncbi:helix-turn-helix domain-containing protein [Rhodobacteraceae bacterium B1Z28]|uniref:Helix-turn-helix domain-containing protein n=1 Tax=Ruegeria haliotis TaxID=2747601 RepID=A0ABX2PQ12_9RHOB|nr:helix-turn-helix domain-containing protein [Ruegeria haliotis]NVO55844.1 helix-turn-helix domain-containing protein [Ruegeria haliotis]
MPKWTKYPSAPQHIGVLLFDGFSNHCLANTVEPLRAANMLSGRTLYDWQFLSIGAEPVISSSGLQVAPHGTLQKSSGDLLMVMPSYGFQAHGGWQTLAGLRSAALRYDVLTGLDTGSWLLALAGLLDGHRATIHWEELTRFTERFPEVDALRERYIIDGNRITCSGAMAAFDLVLHLIGQDQGQALALEVAQLFMTRDSARSHAGGAGATSGYVNKALAVMQEHLETPLTVSEIANRVGRSQKALAVRMNAELGAGPAQVYRRLRLNLARKLVTETDMTIGEIALRAGYDDPSALTRAFKTEFGVTPRALRTPQS